MLERNIQIKEIQETIDFPDYTIKKNNKIEMYKRINHKNIKIICSDEGKFIKVITVIDKS